MEQRGEEIIPEHVAKGFQDSVVEVLTAKTLRAARAVRSKTSNCSRWCLSE